MGHARSRMRVSKNEEPPLLDGIPVAQGSDKRKSRATPIAPPLTEVSPETYDPGGAEGEDPLPLTQPGLRVDVHCLLLPQEEEPTQANESA